MFSVVVGQETPKTFLLHSELLASESDRLAKDVNGGFIEQSSRRILIHEEDSELFGYLVEYLYRTESLAADNQVLRDSDLIILARLYALGERLQAYQFQLATLRRLSPSLSDRRILPEQGVC